MPAPITAIVLPTAVHEQVVVLMAEAMVAVLAADGGGGSDEQPSGDCHGRAGAPGDGRVEGAS